MLRTCIATASLMLAGATALADQPTIITSSGSDAEVTGAVNAFRAALGGGASNANVIGSFLSGRREINWDGVPDSASAPNPFPPDFFNQPATGRARGAEFVTDGSGFSNSADDNNPTGTPKDFANIDPSYLGTFREFSPQRLFVALDSVTTEVRFFIPGQSRTRATVTAFGVVFTDVDLAGSTRLDVFDKGGARLAGVAVSPSTRGQGGFSFAGIILTGGEQIYRVVITSGNRPLGPGVVDDPAAGVDLVVMDDFLYSEPVAATNPEVFAGAGADQAGIQAAVDAFRNALGALNPNQPGSFGSGRREINWDGVPDTASSPNAFPANFFNANSPRGAVFSTPGPRLLVSADNSNPAGAAPEFADIDPSYGGLFRVFSPQRLFIGDGSTLTTTDFLVPGSATDAFVKGFGSVFTDVDVATSTRIDWRDQAGDLLASIYVPVGATAQESLSFLGARFGLQFRVASVTIQSGTTPLGPGVIENIAGGIDLVTMDDFIYGEPSEMPPFCAADANLDGSVNSQDFFDFLIGFFSGDADFDQNGQTNTGDFFAFLTAFFTGC